MVCEPDGVDVTDQQEMSYVEAAGRTWGWQWRRNFGSEVSVSIASGSDFKGQAARDHRERNYPEVFMGDGLVFACALKHLPEDCQIMARVHYIITAPAKTKWPELGIQQAEYWRRVRKMKNAIASFVYG